MLILYGRNCRFWTHFSPMSVLPSVLSVMANTRSEPQKNHEHSSESPSHSFFLFFFFFFFFWLCWVFVSVQGLFSSRGKQGPLFIAARGPLTIVASLVAEHRLQTHRLSSCGSQAQLLCDMWDLPRPGLEPVSLALAGRFSTTVPPGKPPTMS